MMKPSTLPTLSEYLLYESCKYLPHPHRQRRTKTIVRDLELFDKVLGEMVEGRRTFTPHEGAKILNDPVFIDDRYCRELLRKVPEMVRVTLELRELSLPESKSEWSIYLRESAKCLILGLRQAAVALARAAVESRLCEAYAKLPCIEADAARNIELDDLISNLSNLFNLSKGAAGLSLEEEGLARRVQRAGNNVLHGNQIEAEEAMKVFEAARSMIQSMSGKARP